MDIETAKRLCQVNTDFYREHAASFSETRRGAWAGWSRVLEAAALPNAGARVLDVACGNMRFAAFLEERLGDFAYWGVDNCDALASARTDAWRFQRLDIAETLLNGDDLAAALDASHVDLAVAFGFMHHIPTEGLRAAALRALLEKTKLGGVAAVSFWRFLNSPDLAAKAEEAHARGLSELGLPPLDANDYLLGWKHEPHAFRYCHTFTDAEIDRLAEAVADCAVPVARFSADGRTGNLNTYLVVRKKHAGSLS